MANELELAAALEAAAAYKRLLAADDDAYIEASPHSVIALADEIERLHKIIWIAHAPKGGRTGFCGCDVCRLRDEVTPPPQLPLNR